MSRKQFKELFGTPIKEGIDYDAYYNIGLSISYNSDYLKEISVASYKTIENPYLIDLFGIKLGDSIDKCFDIFGTTSKSPWDAKAGFGHFYWTFKNLHITISLWLRDMDELVEGLGPKKKGQINSIKLEILPDN